MSNAFYDYPNSYSYSSNIASSSSSTTPNHYPSQPRKAFSLNALQVSTDAAAAQPTDPSEETARPSNAHLHAQFHHQLPLDDSDSVDQLQDEDQLQENSQQQQQQADEHESPQSLSSEGSHGPSRPLTQNEQDLLAHLDRLKYFLATAPSHWSNLSSSSDHPTPINPHPALHRFLLPSQEYVSCILWSNLYHITGTDIVRALVFRFEAFGRPVRNIKKFEEGIFSDLRNLKPGIDACLEEPKSAFLDLLFKHQAIRTQKKQKVFYWFSVPHDRLFLDALERDLKREKMGLEPTTRVEGEPAQSFVYDPQRGLYEQFCGSASTADSDASEDESGSESDAREAEDALADSPSSKKAHVAAQNPYLAMFSLFEGSPLYKQRRKKTSRAVSNLSMIFDPSGHPNRSKTWEYPSSYRSGPYGSSSTDLTAEEMFRMQARGEISGPKTSDRKHGYDAQHSSSSPNTWERHVPQRAHTIGSTAAYDTSNLSASYSNGLTAADTYGAISSKVFECPLFSCGKIFKFPEQLQRHVRKHALTSGNGRLVGGDTAGDPATGVEAYQPEYSGQTCDVPVDEEGMVVAVAPIATTGANSTAPGTLNYSASEYDPYGVDPSHQQQQQQHATYTEYTHSDPAGAQWVSAPPYTAGNDPAASFGSVNASSGTQMPLSVRNNSSSSLGHADMQLNYEYGSAPSSQHPHQHHHISISAPAFKGAFDHERLTQVTAQMQQHPHTPYGIPIPLTSSPPRFGHGYASSGTSSAASSVSGGSPPSSVGSSSGMFVFEGGNAAANVSSGGGPVRRHRSMTPSLMRADEAGSPYIARPRPLTATSTTSGGEFSALQQASQQQGGAALPTRGRGYHPYANGYVSRSTSLSTNGSASTHSSPMSYSLPLGAVDVDMGGVSSQQQPGYRTESPGEFARSMDMDSNSNVATTASTSAVQTHHPHPHNHQQQQFLQQHQHHSQHPYHQQYMPMEYGGTAGHHTL